MKLVESCEVGWTEKPGGGADEVADETGGIELIEVGIDGLLEGVDCK